MKRALELERSAPRKALMLYYHLTERSTMVLRRSMRLFAIIVSAYSLIFSIFLNLGLSIFFFISLVGACLYHPRTKVDRNLGYLAQLGIARCYMLLGAPYKAYRYLEVARVESPPRLKALHESLLAIIRGRRKQALAHLDRARERHNDLRTWGLAWPYYRSSATNTGKLMGAMKPGATSRSEQAKKGTSTGVDARPVRHHRERAVSGNAHQIQCIHKGSAPTKHQLLKEAFRLEPTKPHSAIYLYNQVGLKSERALRKLALLFLLILIPLTLDSVCFIFVILSLVIVLLIYGEPHRFVVARELAPLGAARCYLRTGQTNQANRRLNQVFKRRLPYLRPLYNATVSIGAGRNDQVEHYLKRSPLYNLSKASQFYYRSSLELTRRLSKDLAVENFDVATKSPQDERWRKPAQAARSSPAESKTDEPTPEKPIPVASKPLTTDAVSSAEPVVSVINDEGHLDPTVKAGEPDPLTFTIGSRIYHLNLGAGTIQARFPHGRNWRLRVQFDRSTEIHDVISNYLTPMGKATAVEPPSKPEGVVARFAGPPGVRPIADRNLRPVLPFASPVTPNAAMASRPLPAPIPVQASSAGQPAPRVPHREVLQEPYHVEWMDLITVEASGTPDLEDEITTEPEPVQVSEPEPASQPELQQESQPDPQPESQPDPQPSAPPVSATEGSAEANHPSSWPVQWVDAEVDDRVAELDQRLAELTQLVLEPKDEPDPAPTPASAPEATQVEVEAQLSHRQAQVLYLVRVRNLSSRPILDVKVKLHLEGLQFKVVQEAPNQNSLAPGGSGKFLYLLEPTTEGANGTLKADLSYIDHQGGMTVEQPIEALATGIVWPRLSDMRTDRKWREVTRGLVSHKERFDGAPLPPGLLFELVCRILGDLNLRSRKPKLIETSSFYSGRARFMAQDEAGRSCAVQAEVVGGPLRTRLLLRVYAPCEASVAGLYHLVREELTLRLEVGEASDPVVYQVNGDFVEGSKTEVRDSVVSRWAANSDA